MRHVLAPTGEVPVGKVVIKGDRVTVVAGTVIDSVLKFLNYAMEKRLAWYKGDGTGGCVVQNPDVQVALNPIKLYARAVGRK
jgi:hypothetical protein